MRYVDLMETPDSATQNWANQVAANLGLSDFSVHRKGEFLHLSMMKVPKELWSTGVGSQAMQEFCRYADEHSLIGTLSPADKSDGIGTTSRSRLIAFYKRFGFVENKGRNKDYGTTASMIRPLNR